MSVLDAGDEESWAATGGLAEIWKGNFPEPEEEAVGEDKVCPRVTGEEGGVHGEDAGDVGVGEAQGEQGFDGEASLRSEGQRQGWNPRRRGEEEPVRWRMGMTLGGRLRATAEKGGGGGGGGGGGAWRAATAPARSRASPLALSYYFTPTRNFIAQNY